MKILVAGSRDWTDAGYIRERLEKFPAGTILVHGGNGLWVLRGGKRVAVRGADAIAGDIGQELGFIVRVYPADWTLGRSGGPRRNTLMLRNEHVHLEQIGEALLFHPDIEKSKGTKDMRNKLYTARIPYRVFPGEGAPSPFDI